MKLFSLDVILLQNIDKVVSLIHHGSIYLEGFRFNRKKTNSFYTEEKVTTTTQSLNAGENSRRFQ